MKPTQQELRTFVDNNVFLNQSMLVQELLEKEVVNIDNITNFYISSCPECGGEVEELTNLDTLEKDAAQCKWCKHLFPELPESEPQEIYEWYACSDWLIKQLELQGEPILKTDFGTWWGRTCTGQAISLDSVIKKIYSSL